MSSRNYFRLDGKTALVTGCSKGIGKAIAEGLAEAGADIIGVSSTLPSQASEIEKSVTQLGRKFYPYQVDLVNRQELTDFIITVKKAHPVIDILVNNAGIIKRKPAAEHEDSLWDQVISVNLDAPFILSRELGKEMIQRKSGKIIFIASLLSFQGGINVPGYTASKSAIGGLIKALSNEWASHGVNVNGIAPGYIATDNTEALRENPERSKSILDRIPAGRWGTAEDLKAPAVFLASDAANYVHGTILTVDGGWMGR